MDMVVSMSSFSAVDEAVLDALVACPKPTFDRTHAARKTQSVRTHTGVAWPAARFPRHRASCIWTDRRAAIGGGEGARQLPRPTACS